MSQNYLSNLYLVPCYSNNAGIQLLPGCGNINTQWGKVQFVMGTRNVLLMYTWILSVNLYLTFYMQGKKIRDTCGEVSSFHMKWEFDNLTLMGLNKISRLI